jgi:sulfate permease, SulP family
MDRTTTSVGAQARAKVHIFLQRYVPIAMWLPQYQRAWVPQDVIVGITIWGMSVPAALAYGQMAGLPPVNGLYAAFVALLIYAVFGTSRQLKVTASSTMAAMSAAAIAPLANGNAARQLVLSGALALLVGLMLLLAGIWQMGFVSDFLAKSVVTGFIFGLAITVAASQIPKLLGLPREGETTPEQVWYLLRHLDQANLWTLAIGIGALGLIAVVRRYAHRVPAGLVALVFGIIVVSWFNLDQYGVTTVGAIPTGLPALQVPIVSPNDLLSLTTAAAGIVFLAGGESIASARAIAARHHQQIDANQELIALGAANLGASLLQGFSVDASLSTTATADEAGARTQLSSIITALLILVTILALAPLFRNVPDAVLGAIVISAVISLMDVGELRRYAAARRTDFVLALIALLGVVFTNILSGLLLAVLLSLAIVLYRSSRPYLAVLGRKPGEDVYADLERQPTYEQIPGLLLLRLDVPLYFFNASTASTQIRNVIAARFGALHSVVLDIGASADLDIASLDMLHDLADDLQAAQVELLLAQVKGSAHDRLRRSGLIGLIGQTHIYHSVPEAVAAALQAHQQEAVLPA